MAKKLIFFTLILFSAFSFSNERKPNNYTTNCEAQIDEKLKELHSKNEWVQIVDSRPSHKTYRSSTSVLGEWVEVIAGDSPSVYHVTPKGIREFGWNLKTCEINKSTVFEQDKKYINLSGPVFTDADLKKLVDQKESAIVYTYSPRMAYSVKYMDDLSEAAEALGFKFIPVLESTYKIGELNKIFPNKRRFKVQKSASVEILMRQMLTHYPSSLVVNQGLLLDPIIVGVKSKDEYQSEISRRAESAYKK
jgi:hypothetical protein